jgi:hypothetical protein
MKPIFILSTRSFWAFVSTIILFLEAGEPVFRSVATLIATFAGGDVEVMTEWLVQVAPISTLLFAMHQRAGNARPYSMDPRDYR